MKHNMITYQQTTKGNTDIVTLMRETMQRTRQNEPHIGSFLTHGKVVEGVKETEACMWGFSSGSWTFNSLIASCNWLFESWSCWASERSCPKIRTASLRMVALSVFGGLPGSKTALNSRNLQNQFEQNPLIKTTLQLDAGSHSKSFSKL